MSRRRRLLLAASGVVPLLGLVRSPPDLTLLIYVVFVVALFWRPHVARAVGRVLLPPPLKLVLLVVSSGMIFEVTKWVSMRLAGDEVQTLVHDLTVFGVGYYGGWALAWIVALRFFRFTLPSVFLTTAVLGVPVEQDAQVLVAIVQSLSANPLASLYLLGYVMLVYGSIMGLAYLPLEEALRHPRQRGHWIKYLVAMALMYVGSAALFVAVSVLARGLGLIASLSRTVG